MPHGWTSPPADSPSPQINPPTTSFPSSTLSTPKKFSSQKSLPIPGNPISPLPLGTNNSKLSPPYAPSPPSPTTSSTTSKAQNQSWTLSVSSTSKASASIKITQLSAQAPPSSPTQRTTSALPQKTCAPSKNTAPQKPFSSTQLPCATSKSSNPPPTTPAKAPSSKPWTQPSPA